MDIKDLINEIKENNNNLLSREIDLRFKTNEDIKIKYISEQDTYEISNVKTGLKHCLNGSAIKIIKFLEGTSFNELINSLVEMHHDDKKYACQLMEFSEKLFENKIIQYEVI